MKRDLYVRLIDLGSVLSVLISPTFLHEQTAVVHASVMNVPVIHADQVLPADSKPSRKAVLVELITSNECDSCQAAKQFLTHLDRDQPIKSTDIIVLHEQVQPSDPSKPSGYLSPTDPTRRQEDYQTLGTFLRPAPLFLVNGEVLGEHISTPQIEESIQKAPDTVIPLKLTSVQIREDTVSFSLENGPATDGYVNVYAALVNPALSSSVNSNQQTEHNAAISGTVETFGRVGGSFRTKALGRGPFNLQSHLPDSDKNLNGKRLVVFVQTKHVGLVLGSTSCVLQRDPSLAGILPQASFPDNVCPVAQDRK